MKYLLMILLLTILAFGQDSLDVNDPLENWNFNVLASPGLYFLNGDWWLPAPAVVLGASRPIGSVTPGGYLVVGAQHVEGQDPNGAIGVAVHIDLFQKFGFGFAYEFWETNIGIQAPQKDNLAFLITYEIIQ